MARPRVRTYTVSEETMEQIRYAFGSASNAYKNLGLTEAMTFTTFQRVWTGKAVTYEDQQAVEQAYVERIRQCWEWVRARRAERENEQVA